ncbi:MAG TPA: ribonuclease H [Gemmatimonadales bacterium]
MTQVAVVHADESCLGNGREGATPGGAGALIEVRLGKTIVRHDLLLASPDTTNNRMALHGAIAALQLLARKQRCLSVVYVSDSTYLVKGMTEWVRGWQARGWRRKGGPIENIEFWKVLTDAAHLHDVRWRWVRGHAGDVKNEYADALAVRAAEQQVTTEGAVESGFDAWLDQRRATGQFTDYDPDTAFMTVLSDASLR